MAYTLIQDRNQSLHILESINRFSNNIKFIVFCGNTYSSSVNSFAINEIPTSICQECLHIFQTFYDFDDIRTHNSISQRTLFKRFDPKFQIVANHNWSQLNKWRSTTSVCLRSFANNKDYHK